MLCPVPPAAPPLVPAALFRALLLVLRLLLLLRMLLRVLLRRCRTLDVTLLSADPRVAFLRLGGRSGVLVVASESEKTLAVRSDA